MSYQDLLHPWVIYRLLADCKHQSIARFRRRNEAEAYLKVLQRLLPAAQFAIVFEAIAPDSAAIEQLRTHTEAKLAERAPMID